jgi:outer membrane protein assembly factor BamB
VAWTGWPYVYVGSSNGRLYELDASDGHSVDAIQLGDPADPAAVGAPTVDGRDGLLYVPSEAGIVYAVELP